MKTFRTGSITSEEGAVACFEWRGKRFALDFGRGELPLFPEGEEGGREGVDPFGREEGGGSWINGMQDEETG
jgi:hypothetical protein